jgi:hypothetical protein
MSDLRLWLVAAAGPAAWAIDFNISYATTPPAHMHGSLAAQYALHAVALAVAIVAAVLAVRDLRRLRGGEDTVTQRRRFLAIAGVGLSLIAILLVIGTAMPTLMIVPGSEP